MEEKEVLERIRYLLEIFHLTVNAFSKEIKMRQNTVNNYMNEERGISFGFIKSILESYPEISAEWLLRGHGEMTETTYDMLNGMSKRINSALSILVETHPHKTLWQCISEELNFEEKDVQEMMDTNTYNYDFLRALTEKLSINPLWLITGQGNMTIEPVEDNNRTIDILLQKYSEERERVKDLEKENTELIRRLSVYEGNKKDAV